MTDRERAECAVRLAGEYDLARKDEVAALFASHDGELPLIVDMTGVTYMDSTVLNELALLRMRRQYRPITLTVNARLRRLLRLVRFDKLFQIGT